jgi:hypothetical protein
VVAIEPYTGSIEFSQRVCYVENAAAKPVDRPHHQKIEPPPDRVAKHRVGCRTLVPAFGAADSLVFIGQSDHPATVPGDLLQDEPLILGALVIAAHSEIDRCAEDVGAHALTLSGYETIPERYHGS